jgi:aerobic carbon-monoxide dehydrogenase large subunit
MSGGGRWFGKGVTRNEDPRLLTGREMFIDDVDLPGMLHVAFVRSDLAHGIIESIDTSEALSREGVVAVYTAEDLGDYWQEGPVLVPPPPIQGHVFNAATIVPLARDRVRHVGEPIAVVIAESPYIAEDAVADVWVDIEPLDAVAELEAALEPDAAVIHEHIGSNLAAHVVQTKGDWAAARASAHTVVSRRLWYDRGPSAPMETRGVVARWAPREEELTVWDTTQAPIPIRNGLAALLGLNQNQVRVIAPNIGGGFGPKMMMFYPEEVLLPWISMKLGRPVKWIEDRQEHFFATTMERGQLHDAEIALAEDGTILGVRDFFLHDTGAYDSYGLTIPINTQCTLLGPYRIPNYHTEFKAVFTNKTTVTPVRGAGRQQGVFVIERLLDLGARELGLDRAEIRRKNFLTPEDFPFDNEILFQDSAPLVYDSGDYEPALDQALERVGYAAFLSRKTPGDTPAPAEDGKLRGLGLVTYVEGTGIGPYEGARVTVEPNGNVSVAMGVGTQGQGHATVFAQVVAEQLGVDIRNVHVSTGDTREFGWGTGTFASRGAVVAGSACHESAVRVREKALKLASEALEAAPEDLELSAGFVAVRGSDHRISLGELAQRANPLRGAVTPGSEPGLEATAYFGPERGTTAFGVHAMIVAVDPETAMIDIEKYVVVHDCGRMINPVIVEGQVHGGVAQGIGNAFYEALHYDDDAQLLNASFMDFLVPTACEVPHMEVGHTETPSPLNPLGVKGVGEAGSIPVGALLAQALDDALSDHGVEVLEIPLSPNRLFELIRQGPST